MHLLQMLGWTQVAGEGGEGGEELVLPPGTFMKMDHVRQVGGGEGMGGEMVLLLLLQVCL